MKKKFLLVFLLVFLIVLGIFAVTKKYYYIGMAKTVIAGSAFPYEDGIMNISPPIKCVVVNGACTPTETCAFNTTNLPACVLSSDVKGMSALSLNNNGVRTAVSRPVSILITNSALATAGAVPGADIILGCMTPTSCDETAGVIASWGGCAGCKSILKKDIFFDNIKNGLKYFMTSFKD